MKEETRKESEKKEARNKIWNITIRKPRKKYRRKKVWKKEVNITGNIYGKRKK
jgi:hypothetical protein